MTDVIEQVSTDDALLKAVFENNDLIERVGEEDEDEVQKEVIEPKTEEVVEEVKKSVEEVVSDVEEEIEDRFVVEKKEEEVVVEKKEPILETKKASIPFKNDTLKIVYNYLSENEGGLQEISNILEKSYEKLSPLELIEFDIRANPDNQKASEGLIKKKLSKIVRELEDSYDLEDPDDSKLYEEELVLKASKIKSNLERKRTEIIEKYSSDVEIEYQQEAASQLSEEEVMAEKESLISTAEKDFAERLKDLKVSIQDKDGPIFVPIDNMKSIAESVVDPIGFIKKLFLDKNGDFMYEAYAKWANYAINPQSHDSILIKKGIAIGKKQVVGGFKNTSSPASRNVALGGNSVNKDTGLPEDLTGFATALLGS